MSKLKYKIGDIVAIAIDSPAGISNVNHFKGKVGVVTDIERTDYEVTTVDCDGNYWYSEDELYDPTDEEIRKAFVKAVFWIA